MEPGNWSALTPLSRLSLECCVHVHAVAAWLLLLRDVTVRWKRRPIHVVHHRIRIIFLRCLLLSGLTIAESLQVLVEGPSKSGPNFLKGRTDGFMSLRIPAETTTNSVRVHGIHRSFNALQPGDYVEVQVHEQDGRLSGMPTEIGTLSDLMLKSTPNYSDIAIKQLDGQVREYVTTG